MKLKIITCICVAQSSNIDGAIEQGVEIGIPAALRNV